MAALSLHHTIFNNEKTSHLPMRSASSFLHPAPERDESPTSHLFTSMAYQDLIQRQPTHPDGPMLGWDLGLNLLGDPTGPEEHKNLEEHQTKMKLRRLHAINVAFELLFAIWGVYTTIRYFIAFVDSSSNTEHVCALVLGIVSALAVIIVIISMSMPLVPKQSHLCAWRYTKSALRTCYLLLVTAGAMMNFVLVLMWQPSHFCGWDIDISWYTSASNTATSLCHPAPSAAWIAAAMLRLLVTCTIALSFVYALRSYHKARHPCSEGSSPRYSPFPTDSEETSPVSPSSAHHLFRSSLKLTRSRDSDRTLSHSHVITLKSNSISTLTPSTGRSRPHSTPPPPKYISPLKISPPTSRRASTHVTNYGASAQFRSESQPHGEPVNAVAESSSMSHMLRRSSRISVAKGTSDATLPDTSSFPERCDDGQTIAHDPSEMPSCPSWRPDHRGTDVHSDIKTTTLAWEDAAVGHASRSNTNDSSGTTQESGGPVDEDVVYSYGYGARGPTYPYLDMYNPQRPGGYADSSSSSEDVGPLGRWCVRATGPSFPDVSSESTSPTREGEDFEETGSGGEEEYVAMMGGFVRRMATIESLGSREAVGTLSTTAGSAARRSSVRSKTPTSQFSSVRFAEYGSSSWGSSLAPPLSAQGSLSTAYLSFSSGGTSMWVNERGELGPRAVGSPCYYTAIGSFSRTNDEDR